MTSTATTKATTGAFDSDPKLNHLVQAQLSKTKMCGMFSRGSCNDAKCRFAHSSKELRRAPDLTKTAICRAFARGGCPKGDTCVFAHGEQELRVTPTVYKTQICNFHTRGHCKKGDRCRHAHGADQLRDFEPTAAIPDEAVATPPLSAPSAPKAPQRAAKGLAPALRGKANVRADRPKSPKLLVEPQRVEMQEPALDALEPMKVNIRGLGEPAFATVGRPGSEDAQAFMASLALEATHAARKRKAACEYTSVAATRFAAVASTTSSFGPSSQTDVDFESILGSLRAPPMQVGAKGPTAMQERACMYTSGFQVGFQANCADPQRIPPFLADDSQWFECASMSAMWVR